MVSLFDLYALTNVARGNSIMYLQSTITECGLCCLGYISEKYGSAFEMSELRTRFAISLQGSTLPELVRIAATLGLAARPLRLELEELSSLQTPCILHWEMSHFVVLLGTTRKGIRIFDPAKGEKSLTYVQVSSKFTGVAIELRPSHEFSAQKPRPPISIKSLIGKISGLRRSLVQMAVLAIALQIFSLLSPMIIQWVVDGAIVSGDKGFLTILCIGFILISIIRIGLEALRSWLSVVLSLQFHLQWAGRITGHLLKLPLNWFELRHVGDVVSRFDSMKSIQQTLTGKIVDIFLDAAFGLTIIAVMFIYSPQLSAIVLFAVVLYALIRILPHGRFHQLNDESLVHEAKANSHFLESVRAVQTVKLSGLEDQRRSRWLNLFVDGANRRVLSQKMSIGFSAGYGIVFAMESIAVLGYGAYMAIDGVLTVGMLMAFTAYKDDFSSRMQRLIDNVMALKMLSLHVERLADIVLTAPEKLETGQGADRSLKHVIDRLVEIEFRNISYRYGADSPWVLKELSFTINAGEHVAIIGPSGCGKTTLAKILLGLLPPTEGEIFINGVPLTLVGLGAWRKITGAVMQEDLLFSGSLQDNIAKFSDVIDVAKIERSARLSAVHSEIVKMPMGYLTLVGDMGSSLSGGQKQRVLLARALYSSPSVLVLDEATSHLDIERERLVNEAICCLKITRIAIAHRPETIAMADRIIDMTSASSEFKFRIS